MKYRVWNETKKRYLNDNDAIPLIAPTGKLNLFDMFADSKLITYIEDELKVEELVYEGKEGIIDLTGTDELHVGDIVRINNFNETFKHGEPLTDYRVFEVIKNGYTFALSNAVIYTPFSHYNKDTLEEYNIEVIGNINENKDLLDQPKEHKND